MSGNDPQILPENGSAALHRSTLPPEAVSTCRFHSNTQGSDWLFLSRDQGGNANGVCPQPLIFPQTFLFWEKRQGGHTSLDLCWCGAHGGHPVSGQRLAQPTAAPAPSASQGPLRPLAAPRGWGVGAVSSRAPQPENSAKISQEPPQPAHTRPRPLRL